MNTSHSCIPSLALADGSGNQSVLVSCVIPLSLVMDGELFGLSISLDAKSEYTFCIDRIVLPVLGRGFDPFWRGA